MIWSTYQLAIFAMAGAADSARNILVQAFAGTGKTTTMAEWTNRSVAQNGVTVAFASKNVEDLKAKVTNPAFQVRSFNSLGNEICRRYMGSPTVDFSTAVGVQRAQLVCGLQAPRDMVRLVAKLAARAKHTLPGVDTREQLAAAGKAASAAGNTALADELRAQWHAAPQLEMEELAVEADLEPDPEWKRDGWDTPKVAKLALAALELARTAHTLKRDDPKYMNAIDGDDQCYLPVANRWVAPRFDEIIVDEGQDTDRVQMRFARGLLLPGGRFVVVGDRYQSLYRFRGADSESMDRFKREMSAPERGGCVELTLPETYRCGKAIVAEAAKLVPGYVAHASCPQGEVKAARYGEVVKLAGPGDFILSRANAPLTALCLKFLKAGKRAKVEGKEVGKGLAAVVEKLKAKSVPDFLDKLNGWQDRECARARRSAKTDEQADAKCEAIADKADCLRAIAEESKGLPELNARIEDLFADKAANGEQVVCMTVHKSKGLETDRVFILADTLRSKGKTPADPARAASKAQDELFIRYVAVTRARHVLTYVHGLDENATAPTAHDAAVQAAAQVTGETLEQVAAAIESVRQLMEKDQSPELQQALAQLEEKQARLTQVQA